MEYQDMFSPVASKFNRVFKRVVDDAKMTKLNLEVIKEIKLRFPDFDKYVELAKLKVKQGLVLEENEETL